MSATAERIDLDAARRLAAEVAELLRPVCTRLDIAGSIRRARPTIGDLEIVCAPIREPELDLFGAETGEYRNLLDERCHGLMTDRTCSHRRDKHGRPAFGERYKRLTYAGFALDLFSAFEPAQYGVILLIRTGSAAFSHRFVTPVEQGGWMPKGCHVSGGAIWRDGRVIETPSEEAALDAVGRPWVRPEEREV